MDQKWFYRLYRIARLQRCYTKQPGAAALRNEMTCSRAEMELVSSTNIMFHIVTETENGFFAPIYQHRDMAAYLQQMTRDYYTFVCAEPELAASDMACVLKDLHDPDGLRRFSKMGSIWYPDSPLSEFMRSGDPSVIGLKSYPSDEAAIERLRVFIRRFAGGAINSYTQNATVRNGQWQTASANRTLAVEALAKILGISYMIPHAEFRTLVIDGKHRCLGLFMERAPGRDLTRITSEERQRLLSPQLQRELNRLSLLDALTGENDHCPENYHLLVHRDRADGIRVFDNNSMQTFNLQWDVSVETILKCAPYVNHQGLLNRPYVDAQMAERLGRISVWELFRGLRPYLSALPILSLWIRMGRIRKAIEKSVAMGSARSVGYEEWTGQMLEKELSLDQIKTYLHSYLSDCVHV